MIRVVLLLNFQHHTCTQYSTVLEVRYLQVLNAYHHIINSYLWPVSYFVIVCTVMVRTVYKAMITHYDRIPGVQLVYHRFQALVLDNAPNTVYSSYCIVY